MHNLNCNRYTYLLLVGMLSSCTAPVMIASGLASYAGKKTLLDTSENAQAEHVNRYMQSVSGLNQLVSAETADQYYAIGRHYQQKQNLQMAVVAYQQGLIKNPEHIDLLTSLGSLFASQGKLVLAIPLLERAVNISPESRTYNNLGYAYYLNQQYVEAERVLTQATLLQPDYQPAINNLKLVLANQQADKSIPHDSTDYVVLNSIHGDAPLMNTNRSEPLSSVPLMTMDKQLPNSPGLTKVNEAVYTLTLPATFSSDIQPKDQGKLLLAVNSGGVTMYEDKTADRWLEDNVSNTSLAFNATVHIVNANGIRGIATAISKSLNLVGIHQTKVRDSKHFNVALTQIQYRSGYREEAVALHQLLKLKPLIYKNDALPPAVSVKLVLGKDIS